MIPDADFSAAKLASLAEIIYWQHDALSYRTGKGMAASIPFVLLLLLGAMLAWIDLRYGLIPDWLNFAIAALGLLNVMIAGGPSAGPEAACEGIAIGAVFWLLRRLYFAFRGVQGLGLGDVKFLAAAGIWVGVTGLPVLLLVATLTALGCAGMLHLAGRSLTSTTSMAFGPFLAAGLLLTSGLQQYLVLPV